MKSVLIFILLLPFQVFAKVWNSNRSWNEQAESEYAKWMSNQGPDLFRKLGIATDCADAIIGVRWIFARTHDLPAANTLGDGSVFSSQSAQYDSLPTHAEIEKDQRFLKALRRVLLETSTRTLYVDSYLVSLNRFALAPGAFYLRPGDEMGHAELVARFDLSGMGFPITFFASTVPAKVRDLLVYPFLKVHAPDALLRNGFRRLRWPIETAQGVRLKAALEMPWFSQEQYQINSKMPFDELVFQRLGISLDSGDKLQALAVALIERFQARAQIVQESLQKCIPQPTLCVPDRALFDAYSTYARDASIVFMIDGLNELINSSGHRASEFERNLFDLGKTEVLEINAQRITLAELLLTWKRAQYSSDPRVSEAERWGLQDRKTK